MTNVLLSNVGNAVQKEEITKEFKRTMNPNPDKGPLPGGEWLKVHGWSHFDPEGPSIHADKPLCRTSIGFAHPQNFKEHNRIMSQSLRNPNGPCVRSFPNMRTFQFEDHKTQQQPTSNWCLCGDCKAKSFAYNYRFGRGAVNMMNNNSYAVNHIFNRCDEIAKRCDLHKVNPDRAKLMAGIDPFTSDSTDSPASRATSSTASCRSDTKLPPTPPPRASSVEASNHSKVSNTSERLPPTSQEFRSHPMRATVGSGFFSEKKNDGSCLVGEARAVTRGIGMGKRYSATTSPPRLRPNTVGIGGACTSMAKDIKDLNILKRVQNVHGWSRSHSANPRGRSEPKVDKRALHPTAWVTSNVRKL